MDRQRIRELMEQRLSRVSPRLLDWVYARARRVPAVRKRIEAEYEDLLGDLRGLVKPYRGVFEPVARLPARGRERAEVLAELRRMRELEQDRWHKGFVSGAVYHGDEAHIAFLDEVYGIFSQANPLHSDLWPSIAKLEAEIVSMSAHLLGAEVADRGRPVEDRICGTVTSGGTESILLAVKAYRDDARARRRVAAPRLVVPVTAHAAFDKAAQYFGVELARVPVGADGRADVEAMRRAVDRRTIALVGSAPSFPHGLIDPIPALSELARERGIGCHVDACLGGFLLPWARRLGREVPPFDFSLPGVTSMSADTHKYAYAAKGTSVVLYRGRALRRCQFYAVADWPGGLYFSPTFAGSRPGALSAAAWAAMVSIGEEGYLDAARRILATADRIKHGIGEIGGLRVIGDPLFVIAFCSDELDIYRVLDAMAARGWSLNGLHRPPCVHIAVTLRHAQAGVAERFLSDLRAAVEHVRAHPGETGGMAPIYGLASAMPARGPVDDLLRRYLDLLYEV